jgi:hypothetical protein
MDRSSSTFTTCTTPCSVLVSRGSGGLTRMTTLKFSFAVDDSSLLRELLSENELDDLFRDIILDKSPATTKNEYKQKLAV